MARVSLEQISKFYAAENGQKLFAVHDFSLEVNDAEFVVFVGPSGCGKSTTLRMIAGLEEISEGTLSIDGRRVNDIAPKDRDIAMVFQNYALYPHMSVYENLAFGLKLRRLPRAEIKSRVQDAAVMLGIEPYLARKPKALSGGQRQRVALGRAIVRQPKVFLFDEPLSNLDAKMRMQMRSEIVSLHRRLKATMIYVTHDQIEAMTMGDRIVVMNEGVVQQIDEPLALYNRPQNLFVAGFFGAPSMNFIGGQVEAANGALQFSFAGGRMTMIDTPALKELAGRNVIAGIRPEDLRISLNASDPRGLHGEIESVEPMGAETYVHLRSGALALVCKAERYLGHDVVGQTAWLHADSGRFHFFDSVTGTRL